MRIILYYKTLQHQNVQKNISKQSGIHNLIWLLLNIMLSKN